MNSNGLHMIDSEQQLGNKDNPWDIDGTKAVLRASARTRNHPVLGAGVRLTLPESAGPIPVELDLYPQRLVARYRSNLVRLQFVRLGSVGPENDHVRVASAEDDASTLCLVYPDGGLTLALLGREVRPQPSIPPAPLPNPETESDAGGPPAPQTEADRADRVVLSGRLGRTPQLRETANGRLIARVPVAVHQGEQTVWHNVLFFDDKARQAQEQLSKGQMVMIVGYRHSREIPVKTGGTKTVEEIYGASMQVPKSTP
jgi:hypothetical protein